MTGTPAFRVSFAAKLAVAAAAMVVAFVLCEVAARIVYEAPPDATREPQIAYQSNRATGFLHVPNQRGWLDDGLATINDLGLRGPRPAIPKPAGLVRIMAIGDSTTFGWGVADHETYPAALEKRLRDGARPKALEVVNAGVGAYDLKNAARLLRYFGPALAPDLVLVGVFWNDLPYESVSPDGEPVGSSPPPSSTAAPNVEPVSFLPAPGEPFGPPEARSKPFHIGNQPSGLNRLLRSSRLLFALRHAWLAALAPTDAASNQVRWEMALLEGRSTPAIDAAWDDVRTTLAEIRDMGRAGDFEVVLVVVPIRAQVEGSYPDARYQTRVQDIGAELGLRVVDPLPKLIRHRDERLFIPYDRMHLSARGNEVMAEAVFEALRADPMLGAAE